MKLDKIKILSSFLMFFQYVNIMMGDIWCWELVCYNLSIRVTSSTFYLQFNSIRSQIDGDESKAPSPDFIYELMYNEQEETRFNKIRGNQQVFLAYHGSKSENFHSIITNGLRNNLNKVSGHVARSKSQIIFS